MYPLFHIPTNHRGSTLVISLLLLTVMSVLGLGAMQGALLEEKMASNFRFGETAFHAAEAGLQQAIANHSNNQVSTSFGEDIGSSSYTVAVSESSGIYTVTSSGTHAISGAQRQLTAVLSGMLGTTPTLEQWSDNE